MKDGGRQESAPQSPGEAPNCEFLTEPDMKPHCRQNIRKEETNKENTSQGENVFTTMHGKASDH